MRSFKWGRFSGLFGVGMVLLSVLLASGSASANAALLQLSSDPYTNSTSQHATEVEPDTFSFGSTIVSAFQSGRFFNGGASNIGFATSTNGGASWTRGFLPDTTPYSTPASSVYERVSDPAVAYDAKKKVWLISYLGLFPGGNSAVVDVLVSRSSDGGLTWGTPVVIRADGESNDKNWTACDNSTASPFYGHCYTEFDDSTKHDLVLMSTSTNGGTTWRTPRATNGRVHGIGGQPVVQPGGRVVVPIKGSVGGSGAILSFASADGGVSWGSPIVVATIARHPIRGGIRAPDFPSAEVSVSGVVYVVWSDCRFQPGCSANDLVFSSSLDGVNWSGVTQIPLSPIGGGVDHFLPGIAVHGSSLVVTYYFYPDAACTSSTCRLGVGASSSADGGASWAAPTQLAGPMSLTWLPSTNEGVMVGDYISTSFIGTRAFPVFADASAPTGATLHEAMFTAVGGLTASSVTPAALHVASHPGGNLTSSAVTAR